MTRDDWEQVGMDEKSALKFKHDANNKGLIAFVNHDNFYLRHVIRQEKRKPGAEQILTKQFEVGMVLLGISLRSELGDNETRDEILDKTTRGLARAILPVISNLGTLHGRKRSD